MSEKMTVERFLTIERGLETVRKKPGYVPNPVIEDFWSLIEAYRAAILKLEEYEGRKVVD